MAYHARIMDVGLASHFVERFLALFQGQELRFFSNGMYFNKCFAERASTENRLIVGPSWSPITDATFDTGVIVVGRDLVGMVWVEDED